MLNPGDRLEMDGGKAREFLLPRLGDERWGGFDDETLGVVAVMLVTAAVTETVIREAPDDEVMRPQAMAEVLDTLVKGGVLAVRREQ